MQNLPQSSSEGSAFLFLRGGRRLGFEGGKPWSRLDPKPGPPQAMAAPADPQRSEDRSSDTHPGACFHLWSRGAGDSWEVGGSHPQLSWKCRISTGSETGLPRARMSQDVWGYPAPIFPPRGVGRVSGSRLALKLPGHRGL